MQNLRLRKFSTNLDVDGNFIESQKMCQELKLEDVTGSTIDSIAKELDHLKSLDIRPTSMSHLDMRKITSLKNLVSLNISLEKEASRVRIP